MIAIITMNDLRILTFDLSLEYAPNTVYNFADLAKMV